MLTKPKKTVYTIDGVAVTKKIWDRRKLFGEHAAAVFDFYTA